MSLDVNGASLLLNKLGDVLRSEQHADDAQQSFLNKFSVRNDLKMGKTELLETCRNLGITNVDPEDVEQLIDMNSNTGSIEYSELLKLALAPRKQHVSRTRASNTETNSRYNYRTENLEKKSEISPRTAVDDSDAYSEDFSQHSPRSLEEDAVLSRKVHSNSQETKAGVVVGKPVQSKLSTYSSDFQTLDGISSPGQGELVKNMETRKSQTENSSRENNAALKMGDYDSTLFWKKYTTLSRVARTGLEKVMDIVYLAESQGEDAISAFRLHDENNNEHLDSEGMLATLHDLEIDVEPNHCVEIINVFGSVHQSESGIHYPSFIRFLVNVKKNSNSNLSSDHDETETLEITHTGRAERFLLRSKMLFNLARSHDIDYMKPFEKRDMNITGLLTMDSITKAFAELGFKLKAKHRKCIRELFSDPATKMIRYGDFLASTRSAADASTTFNQNDLHQLLITVRRYVQRAQSSGVPVHDSFLHFDSNGDGRVSSDEFVNGLDQLGIAAEPSKAKRLIDRFDSSRDGSGLDYGQFLRMVSERDEYYIPPDLASQLPGERGRTCPVGSSPKTARPGTGGVLGPVTKQQYTFAAMHRKGPFVAGVSDRNTWKPKAPHVLPIKKSQTNDRNYRQYLRESRLLKLIREDTEVEEEVAGTQQCGTGPCRPNVEDLVGVEVRQSRTSAGYVQQMVKENPSRTVDGVPALRVEWHHVKPHRGKGKCSAFTGTLTRTVEYDRPKSPGVPEVVKRIGYPVDVRNDYPKPKGPTLARSTRSVLSAGFRKKNGGKEDDEIESVISAQSANFQENFTGPEKMPIAEKKQKLFVRVASVQQEANEILEQAKGTWSKLTANELTGNKVTKKLNRKSQSRFFKVLQLRMECFSLLCHAHVPETAKDEKFANIRLHTTRKHFDESQHLDAVDSLHRLFPISFLSIASVASSNIPKNNRNKRTSRLDVQTPPILDLVQSLIELAEAYALCGARSTSVSYVQHALHVLKLVDDIEKSKSKQKPGAFRNEEKLNEDLDVLQLEDFSKMHELFQRLDANGDGQVSLEELITAVQGGSDGDSKPTSRIRKNGPFSRLLSSNQQECLESFMEADKDQSLSLSWPEFISFFRTSDLLYQTFLRSLEASLPSSELMRLRGIFLTLEQTADGSLNGFVSTKALALALVRHPSLIGQNIDLQSGMALLFSRNPKSKIEAFQTLDFDGDGMISWEEFLSFFTLFRKAPESTLHRPRALLLLGTLRLQDLKLSRKLKTPTPSRVWSALGMQVPSSKMTLEPNPFLAPLRFPVLMCPSNVALLNRARKALVAGQSELKDALGSHHWMLAEFSKALTVLYKCEADIGEEKCVQQAKENADIFLCSRHGRSKVKRMVAEMIEKARRKASRQHLNHFDAENAARDVVRMQHLEAELGEGEVELLERKSLAEVAKFANITEQCNSHRHIDTALAYLYKGNVELALEKVSDALASFRTCHVILSDIQGPSTALHMRCTVAVARLYAMSHDFERAANELANAARVAQGRQYLGPRNTSSSSQGSRESIDSPSRSGGELESRQEGWREEEEKETNGSPALALALWKECDEQLTKESPSSSVCQDELQRRTLMCEARERIAALTKECSGTVTDRKLYRCYMELGTAYAKCGNEEQGRQALLDARFIAEVNFGEVHPKTKEVDRAIRSLGTEASRGRRELEQWRRSSAFKNRSGGARISNPQPETKEAENTAAIFGQFGRKLVHLDDWKSRAGQANESKSTSRNEGHRVEVEEKETVNESSCHGVFSPDYTKSTAYSRKHVAEYKQQGDGESEVESIESEDEDGPNASWLL